MKIDPRRLLQSNFVFILVAVVSGVGLFFWAQYWQKTYSQDRREVLSTLSMDASSSGETVQVLKIRENGFLALEVYVSSDAGAELRQRVDLPDKKDAFFKIRGQASNLILEELGEDQKVLILAPGYDEDLVAHLNVFEYSPKEQKLTPIPPGTQLPFMDYPTESKDHTNH